MRSSGPCFDTRHVSDIWMCRPALKKTCSKWFLSLKSLLFDGIHICKISGLFSWNLGHSCLSSFLAGPKFEISQSFLALPDLLGMMWQKACQLTPRVHEPQATNDSASKKGMTKACQRHPIHLWVFPYSDSPSSLIIHHQVSGHSDADSTRDKLAPFSDSSPIFKPQNTFKASLIRKTFQVTKL